MSNDASRPNVDAVLARLKDFQRATVQHAFHRLYDAPDSSHRFLVADEVGLGKTVVASGVIAKAIDRLWETVPRIDVIYVCSNADIARQNVNRLNVMGAAGFSSATRLTMLPLELSGLRDNKVNFVSFTPGTSFEVKAGTGMARERALIYRMLKGVWGFSGTAPLNVLSGYSSADAFRRAIDTIDDPKRYPKGIDGGILKSFGEALTREAVKSASAKTSSLRERFDALCRVYSRSNSRDTLEERQERNSVVGELRNILANTCIKSLEPDLVILDEFQRFKELLVGDSEPAQLARELFTYSDDDSHVRVLLLSATPYKMYTVRDEAGGEDHYSDFIQTLRFLYNDSAKTETVSRYLADMRRCIYRGAEGRAELPRLRVEVEQALKDVMARTERLAASGDRNGMLREVPAPGMDLRTDDVKAYWAGQKIGRQLDHADTVEFWKSAPYLLSFMDSYKLKDDFIDAIESPDANSAVPSVVRQTVRQGIALTLPVDQLEGQEPLAAPHPRLRWMLDDVIERGAWRLLWIPPSLPYYKLEGPFGDPRLSGFTKRLVFSAWRVAPKAIATLISYEAERRMLAGTRRPSEKRSEQIDRTRPLLNFSQSSGRLTGMPVVALLYPSIVLAQVGDSLSRELNEGMAQQPTLEAILAGVERRLQPHLAAITKEAVVTPQEDESWYWAAPILLDLREERRVSTAWFERRNLSEAWAGEDDEGDDSAGWKLHVARVRDLVTGSLPPLGTPPSDLLRVLAEMAVAGPAVCALRALSRSKRSAECMRHPDVRDAAASVAHGFRALFNAPDVISLIRGMNGAEPYWRRILEYSAAGCLQAVLDEYVHVMPSFEGLAERDPINAAAQIAPRIREALGLRTSRLRVDDIRVAGNGRVVRRDASMRARFAMRFDDEGSEDEKQVNRKEHVRTAFNSPFWPFVLASTSVGQEGLDFHLYCHAVVHWNLPSNPVDMEQREGRVHRFKGHAVRRNVAAQYGRELESDGAEDPWAALFDLACDWRDENASDLIPFWVFPRPKGAAIERHVPALPLSRDAVRYAELRKSLVLYRMVFGQPRQEDLLEFLASNSDVEGLAPAEIQIDLTPNPLR